MAAVLGSITVPGRPEDVAVARRFVAETLRGFPRLDTAVLLTSEAVTNAVVHTDSESVTLVVTELADGLRFEVRDAGGDTVPVRCRGSDLREDKRGVLLIEKLARRSGYVVDRGGLTYWFEL